MKQTSKWDDYSIAFLKQNYKNYTYEELSKILNIKSRAIQYKAVKLGLKKGIGFWRRSKSKYHVNEDYFLSWSEKSAYILGFITADGHIATKNRFRLVIGLNSRDFETLDFIRKELASDVPIRHREKTNSIELSISGRKLIHSLIDLGLDTKKNNISNIFDKMPEKYHKDFIRGFFDGDGCMSFYQRQRGKYKSIEYKFSFTNMDLILLEKIREKIGYGNIKNCGNYYVLASSAIDAILALYKYLYTESSVYMKRKKNKFITLFEMKENNE